jgi:zinc protease
MAFNGTRNFPKNEISSFMESIGMRFGAHLNASTSFDETIYMLQVPTDKPDILVKAFQILEDWAHNVTLDPAEIEKERGVVMEEWRGRRGAGARLQDRMFPILLQGSRYADRLPIGKTEVIQGFTPDRLRKFYTDWYRPDLMAVVAVGDFDKAAVEASIRKHFASIPLAPGRRPRPDYDVADHSGTRYALLADKEMSGTSIEIDNLLPTRAQGPIGEYRQGIVNRLFSGMLNARFSDITQKPDAPFLSAGVSRGAFLTRSKDSASLFARVKDDGLERGLDAILGEVERVSRFGFTAPELDRQRQSMLRAYERNVAEKENRLSGSRAAEYIRNFLVNETLPTADDEYALHQRFLPEITLNELNGIAKEWFTDRNRLVIVNAPDKAGVVLPTESRLEAVIKTARSKELTPYLETAAAGALFEANPTAGAVTRTTAKATAGITEWELSNGVKVVLKPTTFREDEILFRAISPGGTSLAADRDFIPADTATMLITAGGLGKFSAVDLRKVLTGKVASASPFINELQEGLSGSSSRKDLETMFQLIHLRFTEPRADMTAFQAQTTQLRAMLANQAAVPEIAFQEALVSAMSQNHLRRRMPTVAQLDEFNLDKSLAFYRDRFADASDFTFVFVGNLDPATMRPLVERYLGSLPSTRRKESWKDVGVRLPTGLVERTVEKGIEPKSQSAIVFGGSADLDLAQRTAFRAMTHILQTRLMQAIREDLGGTYSITAGQTYQKFPRPEYSVTIRFGSAPERTNDLIKRVFQEIDQFKTDGPTDKQISDEKVALLREFETNNRSNSFLVGQLSQEYQNGEEPGSFLEFPTSVNQLDAAAIQQAARRYLDTNNYIKVVMLPEKK